MIALQVAWILSRDPNINVCGVLMVDSPFPDYRHALSLALESPMSEEDGQIPIRNKLETSMLQTVSMLHKWKVPVWRRERQPYTVMLCASDHIVLGEDHPALSLVDQFRDSPTLGWNERAGSSVINESYSVKGHHFSLFDSRNVSIAWPTQSGILLI